MRIRIQIVSAIICISIGMQSIAQTQTYIPPQEMSTQLEEGIEALGELADLVPDHLYSVDAKVDVLDHSPESAVTFVSEDIAFDTYVGVLRGPSGTLSTGAGSSWDQSVLLAAMLRSMAVDAMVVTGELSSPEATSLLAQTFAKRPVFEEFVGNDEVSATLGDSLNEATTTALLNAISSPTEDPLSRHIVDASRGLLQHLSRVGTEFDRDTSQLKANLARHYAWVRYREYPGQPWTHVHPAFGGASPPSPERTGFYADTVPAHAMHQI